MMIFSHGDPMRTGRAIVCAAALIVPAFASASPQFSGDYRLAGGPDVAGELILGPDHRFRYALSAGALDERAQGRWTEADGQVRLYTEPRPTPAFFSAGPQAATKEGSLKLLVLWPDGSGIAGVDFTIGFDSGSPETGYTQDYGWTMSHDERRIPRWVELIEPIHGIASPRFAIDVSAGNALTFVLTPNDIGVVNFDGTLVERVDRRLILHHRLGDLTFVSAR